MPRHSGGHSNLQSKYSNLTTVVLPQAESTRHQIRRRNPLTGWPMPFNSLRNQRSRLRKAENTFRSVLTGVTNQQFYPLQRVQPRCSLSEEYQSAGHLLGRQWRSDMSSTTQCRHCSGLCAGAASRCHQCRKWIRKQDFYPCSESTQTATTPSSTAR